MVKGFGVAGYTNNDKKNPDYSFYLIYTRQQAKQLYEYENGECGADCREIFRNNFRGIS